MALSFWSKRLNHLVHRPGKWQSRQRRFRPYVEFLETRTAPAVLTVTSAADTHQAGLLTLREAVAQANTDAAGGQSDTIQFDPGLGSATITLAAGPLELSGASSSSATETIDGGGLITVSGGNASRVFDIASSTTTILTGLTVADGFLQESSSTTDFIAAGAGIANAGNLTLSNVTVTNNNINATLTGADGASVHGYSYGGGIANTGTLTLSDSTVSGDGIFVTATNDSSGSLDAHAYGGGIYNTGTLTVVASTITGDGAGCSVATSDGATSVLLYGGGIYSTDTLTLIGSTITDSSVYGNTGGSGGTDTVLWYGGGIYSSGPLTAAASTIANNYAVSAGGGIYNTGQMAWNRSTIDGNSTGGNWTTPGSGFTTAFGAGLDNAAGTATLTNCTIANNTISSSQADDGTGSLQNLGGGVYNSGTLALQSCTVTGNATSAMATAGDALLVAGGGLYNDGASAATLLLHNTLVAGNTAQTSGPDAAGSFASQGFNLVGVTDGSTGWTASDLTGTAASPLNAKLGTLGNYGGPTQTVPLLAGSPALHAGSSALVPATDQRGVARGPAPNIGAYEATAAALAFSGPASVTAGAPFSLTVAAVDAFGQPAVGYTGSVHFTASNGAAANYTFTAGDGGQHTFNLVLRRAGTLIVTGTDTANPAVTGTTTISVAAAAAVGFDVMAPASVAAGAAFTITVVAVDQYGNIDTHYTGTVHFTTSDTGTGVLLPVDYTFQPGDGGMATFPGDVTLVTPGDQTLTVTDTVSGITGSATITVT
jgi:hypothetical protein